MLFRTLLAFGPVFAGFGIAHSWVEQLSNIASNASFVGEYGYPRGFFDKGTPCFNQPCSNQTFNLWMIPPLEQQPPFIHPSNLLCRPSQRSAGQPPDYPRLRASPGSTVAMRYAENGHVTSPGGGEGLSGKPEQGGTVFVFGTAQPRSEETLSAVLEWNAAGSGGDKRGVMLASQNFDDGRCYQINAGVALADLRKQKFPNPLPGQPNTDHELLCETDVQLPRDLEVDRQFTLYWVWQWPTAPGKDVNFPNGKDEYYTSCVDVDVVEEVVPAVPSHPILQQDPMPTAVADFQSRSALTTDPMALYSRPGFGPARATNTLATVTHRRHR